LPVRSPPVGPGATHHAGAVVFCRPRWRVPWMSPMRIMALLLAAAVAKVVGDLGFGPGGLHRALRVVTPLCLIAAAYLLAHPFAIRFLFARSRRGTPVEVRWAGRHRSGQSWLVLHSDDGRAWRVLPRRGPASYPFPRWRGTPWLEPPPPATGPIRGTFLQPPGTWRRGLILHTPAAPSAGRLSAPGYGSDVLALGAGAEACTGVHLQSVRRVPMSPAHDGSASRPHPRAETADADPGRTSRHRAPGTRRRRRASQLAPTR
jgi:hypothetical protein